MSYITSHKNVDIQAVNENVEFWFYFMGLRKELEISQSKLRGDYLQRSVYTKLNKLYTKHTVRSINPHT